MGAVMQFHDRDIALIRKTVARDCNPAELDWFISICRSLRLDPLRRQIYAFVFHADNAKKRQMIPVIAIGGYRAIAERTGSYRPGRCHVTIDPDLVDPATNPRGISHADASVWKYTHGDWHEIVETAYWEEFAPIKERWDNGQPTGIKQLDPKKEGWTRMPRVMIEKCAEAKALRRGWPDDFSGTYVEGELDLPATLDLTPTEMADAADRTDRLALIGGPNALMVQWEPTAPLDRVPLGKFGDRAIDYIERHMRPGEEEPTAVIDWATRNRATLREYWGHDKDGALEINRVLEQVRAFVPAAMEAAE